MDRPASAVQDPVRGRHQAPVRKGATSLLFCLPYTHVLSSRRRVSCLRGSPLVLGRVEGPRGVVFVRRVPLLPLLLASRPPPSLSPQTHERCASVEGRRHFSAAKEEEQEGGGCIYLEAGGEWEGLGGSTPSTLPTSSRAFSIPILAVFDPSSVLPSSNSSNSD